MAGEQTNTSSASTPTEDSSTSGQDTIGHRWPQRGVGGDLAMSFTSFSDQPHPSREGTARTVDAVAAGLGNTNPHGGYDVDFVHELDAPTIQRVDLD